MKKNSCTPINATKYSCYGLKNSYKEFVNEKKFLRLENSPSLPHNFPNGPSLNRENREHQSGVNQFVVLWPVFCCDGGGCVYICTCIRRQVECTLYWGQKLDPDPWAFELFKTLPVQIPVTLVPVFVVKCTIVPDLTVKHPSQRRKCFTACTTKRTKADFTARIYMSEFIQRYLQKFQVRFNNLTLEVNKKRLTVASQGFKRTNKSLETHEELLLA